MPLCTHGLSGSIRQRPPGGADGPRRDWLGWTAAVTTWTETGAAPRTARSSAATRSSRLALEAELDDVSGVRRTAMTSAVSCLMRSSSTASLYQADGVHDADDGRVHRGHPAVECRLGGLAVLNEEHAVPDAGVYRVDGEHGPAPVGPRAIARLYEEQLRAPELGVLLRGDHRSHDLRDQHQPVVQWSTMPTIAASAGTSAGRKGKDASRPRT